MQQTGQLKTNRVRAALAIGAIALLACALAPPAIAAPSHAPLPALGVAGLNHACGAAVDSHGDLYLASAGASEVKVYDASHSLLTSIADVNTPCGLAVTATGNLYVSEKATGDVVRFKPTEYPFSGIPAYGSREVIDSSGQAKGIAVDSYDSRLYVAEGTSVSVYEADGSPAVADEVQRVSFPEATGGTYKLEFGGQKTGPIPLSASAGEVQTALAGLSSIGAGNVSVEGTGSFAVTFTGALGHSNVEALVGDASGLTGGAKPQILISEDVPGSNGKIGEGALTEATGVASYTYTNDTSGGTTRVDRYLWVADAAGLSADRLELFSASSSFSSNVEPDELKLRRELNGSSTPDGSFGFGAGGAYLAADPGNGEAGGKCASIGEQACTSGHIFLYDAAHEKLDEFDAAGEYLDQVENGSFADAEPTAIAIDRSGGAHDGTLYVTAGAGAGARALAFGPLKAPSRAVLGEPISKVQQSIVGAATDSHGDVYVVAGAKIRVYEPNGTQIFHVEGTKKLPMIEDKHSPYELAVDSTGRIYVRDGNGGASSEFEVTYYTPSAYPPTSTTTYTRRESPVATYAEFGRALQAIAINPGPGPGKDHLFVGSSFVTGEESHIHEYDSAAHGSTLLNGEFAKGFLSSAAVYGLAVDGRSGNVYMVGSFKFPFEVFNPAGTEVLARINANGAGGPAGPSAGGIPRIAVDQSNGHVLQYDDVSTTAREYDASGAFVAEFGNFTQGLNKDDFGIAFDSACAYHEPPLTGAACEAYDPANGTVYVAVDDSNPEHPPYDLTAFGPLSYPGVGEAPVALTGGADEFGPGAATLHGSVDPKGTLLEECRFEYLTEDEYRENGETFAGAETKACAESAAEIGAGIKAVSVHARIEGLAETPYRFRLLASSAGGASEGEAALFGPPQVESLPPLSILYREASLRAKVDPSGLATKYRFDYVDSQGFEEQGGFEGPATRHSAWAELAAGEAAAPVSAAITGLGEGTGYRYRAVAENDAATTEGPVQSFVTQLRRPAEECSNAIYRFGLSANLPDCRAYELVTPAQTDGLTPYATAHGTSNSRAFSNWLTVQRGEGAGERLSYFTDGTLPGFEGNGILDGYRAERGTGEHPAGGWRSDLFSPDYAQAAPGFKATPFQLGVASDQLYSAWQIRNEPQTFPQTLPAGTYLRTPDGFEALGKGSLGTDLGALSDYVSAGGTHTIFSSKKHLEEKAAPEGTETIYDRAAGKAGAEAVSVSPDGSAFGAGEDATYIGAGEDGATVAFSVKGTLYLHREGETTEIAEAPNTFAGISADGKRVFYAATNSGNSAAPLYACDAGAGPCAGEDAHEPTEIADSGIFALVSPDGGHVFFSSEEVLGGEGEENENCDPECEQAEPGARNLYNWDGAAPRFVARLSAADFEDEGFAATQGMNLGAWTHAIALSIGLGRAVAPTRSTPEGGAFVFQSHARLTAYDNEGVGEIYRYEPTAPAGERLLCVSCDPSGAEPSADALLEDIRPGAGRPARSTTMIANLTDDGNEVFFQSFDRLVPEDANEAEDVYEWRAQGTEGPGGDVCRRPGGCLALISSGQGEVPSFLYAMSADGHDVFFETQEKLVGMDQPGSPSIYDARVGGGIPEPIEAAPCQGDACQGQGALPPGLPAPASSGAGEGNETTRPRKPRCARGKRLIRRKGRSRCVAKNHHRGHRRHRHKRRRAGAGRGGSR